MSYMFSSCSHSLSLLCSSLQGAAPIGSQDIRIQVAVHGLGPKFVLRISLQNASAYPILQSRLVLSFDPALYCMGFDHRSLQNISVPVLLPVS